LPESVRDPRYWVPIAALLGVIAISLAFRGGSSDDGQELASPPASPIEATATTASAPTAAAKPTPELDDVLLDSRRALDLAKLAEILDTYRQRNGAYPSTAGVLVTMCARGGDAGCAVTTVARDIPFNDGELPYWYASDAKTATLVAHAEIESDSTACPTAIPAELASGALICLQVEAR
jgi:hypothetical protein